MNASCCRAGRPRSAPGYRASNRPVSKSQLSHGKQPQNAVSQRFNHIFHDYCRPAWRAHGDETGEARPSQQVVGAAQHRGPSLLAQSRVPSLYRDTTPSDPSTSTSRWHSTVRMLHVATVLRGAVPLDAPLDTRVDSAEQQPGRGHSAVKGVEQTTSSAPPTHHQATPRFRPRRAERCCAGGRGCPPTRAAPHSPPAPGLRCC